MFTVVVWLDVFDFWNVDLRHVVRLLDVKLWKAPMMSTTKFDGQVWRVLLPTMASRQNTALVMNIFSKEVKCCPAFPSPDESASDWVKDSTGNYTVKIKK